MTLQDGSYEYDVCLSFAGEQREYVQRIADGLRQRGIRVFYDGYETATLWGKDLYAHLDWVYQNAARYCVLFASADYANKVWTSHERKSAQARALQEKAEYILPVRFDDTQIPGLRPTVAYIDLRLITADELLHLIIEKVRSNMPSASHTASSSSVISTHSSSSRTGESAVVVSLKPRTGDGPVEAFARGQRVVAFLPLEGGGRLTFEVDRPGAKILADRLTQVARGMTTR